MLILTGQRRDEVARKTWGEVDLEARLWTLPKERSKNGSPHDIPLSELAIAILASLPRIGDSFVLTTDGKAASSNYSAREGASGMTDLTGLTRTDCASACNADGCVISGRPRCLHPCKSGLPIESLNDPTTQAAFNNACVVLGVKNIYYTPGASA